jgi:hypothetical protein
MIIRVERSGGFAGLAQRAEIDTGALDPQDRQKLQDLVESTGFFQAPPSPEGDPGGADRFQWQITVERGSDQHTVTLHEGSLPLHWEPLIETLQPYLRRGR